MDNFYSWPLSKQYLAAHFYLSEEKPISLSEAQRAQLGALHLYVSFGKYTSDLSIPDLNLCSQAEKKKRVEEWKKLSCLTRSTAMEKFLDLLTSLFPNWTRSRKLMYEFQLEWSFMQQTDKKTYTTQEKFKNNSKKNRRFSAKPLISSIETINHKERGKIPVEKLKISRFRLKKPKINRTHSIEIPNSLYSFKDIQAEHEIPKYPIVTTSLEMHRKSVNDGNYLKNFIENLQSYKGGNIKDTSATKFPKNTKDRGVKELSEPDPPIDFEKELKNYRRSLLQNEFDKFKTTVEPPSLNAGLDKIHETLLTLRQTLQHLT
ncbi:hypothetical protein SteCoe_12291 [Stentor coeruleus]|uniref:ACB domain-containing protein n=1 Tax=Stentor coeruleus TaxID=5963 RepID=A0A1R2CB49_9CILI|nr:hypothetical protein SteCoe_12291 [Stentor coeruleus]